MATIGEQLRAARLARDLTLDDLTEETKIRQIYLECLEEGRYEELPDAFCLVNFQRQYAQALGVDEAEAVRALRDVLSGVRSDQVSSGSAAPEIPGRYLLGSAMSTIAGGVRRRIGTYATACVALALIVAGLVWLSSLEPVANEPDLNVSRDAPPAPSQGSAAPRDEAATPVPAETSQDIVSVAQSPAPSPAVTEPQTAEEMEIEIRATDRLWVRYIVDEGRAREMTLAAGERSLIRADSVVQVSVGDAAGTVLVVDGQVHDRIGESGQVRHIRVTREGWSFVPSGSF